MPSPPPQQQPSPPTPGPSNASSSAPKVKRKRLAKACDPCHKSKRRCDGTSPCANCDFAGKLCVYTDASGQVIQPPAVLDRNGSLDRDEHEHRRRKLTSGSSSSVSVPSVPPRYAESPRDPGFCAPPEGSSVGIHSGMPSIGRLEPTIVHELVNLFFFNVHPYTMILHRPTFLHDLSMNRVPPYLLLAVFSLSAVLCTQAPIRTSPRHWAGEKFALAAKELMLDPLGNLKVRPNLEAAQALTLITMHDCIRRQAGNRTDFYQHIALDILADLGIHAWDIDSHSEQSSRLPRDEWLRREAARRLFYVIYMVELLASVFTHRPLSHRERDLRIFLPLPEAAFDLVITDASQPHEYLLPLAPNPNGTSRASEFGFLVRIVAVYTRIADNLFACQHQDSTQEPSIQIADVIYEGEAALTLWERSLPQNLAFNEKNLQFHIDALASGASIAGWSYCYMHSIAECCVLSLQEAAEKDRTPAKMHSYADTRRRALENLKVILTSMGTRGRTSIMMGIILETAVKHSKLSNGDQPDPIVATWCADYESVWGVGMEQLTSLEFKKAWVPDYPQDRLSVPQRRHQSSSGSSPGVGVPGRPAYPTGDSSTAGQTIVDSDCGTEISVSASPVGDGTSPVMSRGKPFKWPTSANEPPGLSPGSPYALRPVRVVDPPQPNNDLPQRRSPPNYSSPQLAQMRSHTFPSATARGHPRHEYEHRNTYPSRPMELESRERYELPPPKISDIDGEAMATDSRNKATPAALPSLQSVGLLQEHEQYREGPFTRSPAAQESSGSPRSVRSPRSSSPSDARSTAGPESEAAPDEIMVAP